MNTKDFKAVYDTFAAADTARGLLARYVALTAKAADKGCERLRYSASLAYLTLCDHDRKIAWHYKGEATRNGYKFGKAGCAVRV